MSHEHEVPTYDYAAANQKRFDTEANLEELDTTPYILELAQRVATAMIEQYSTLFDADKTTLLDFACGTGVCPHTSSSLMTLRRAG